MLWHAIVGALLADAGDALAVVRRPGATPTEAAYTQATTGVAAGLRASRGRARAAGDRARPCDAGRRGGDGDAARARGRAAGARSSTQPLGFAAGHLGADAVAERTEAFDPLAVAMPARS